MANSCFNSANFFGEKSALKKIEKVFKKCSISNIEKIILDSDDLTDLRDRTTFVDLQEEHLHLEFESAWSPRFEFLQELSDLYNTKVTCLAEECGEGIYQIYNDPEYEVFKEVLMIDFLDENELFEGVEGTHYFNSEQEAEDFLNEKNVKHCKHSLNEWISVIREREDDVYFHYYERV